MLLVPLEAGHFRFMCCVFCGLRPQNTQHMNPSERRRREFADNSQTLGNVESCIAGKVWVKDGHKPMGVNGGEVGRRGRGGIWGDRGRDKPQPLLYCSEGCAGSRRLLGQYSRGCGLSLPRTTPAALVPYLDAHCYTHLKSLSKRSKEGERKAKFYI